MRAIARFTAVLVFSAVLALLITVIVPSHKMMRRNILLESEMNTQQVRLNFDLSEPGLSSD